MAYNWNDYESPYYYKSKKSKYSYYDDGDYYSSKSSGYSKGSEWDWRSTLGSSYLEDDDKNLYVKSHQSYFTPKSTDFEYRLTHKTNTKSNKDLIKEMSRFFYYNMLGEKDFFEEKYNDLSKLDEGEVSRFQQKKEYYDALWDKDIPGFSPLEKALFVFSQLEGDSNNEKGEYTQKEVSEAVNGIRVNKELYSDPILNELLEINEFSKKRKFKLLNKLSMIKSLGAEFKVQKETSEKIVSNSMIYNKKMMRDYAQIANIEMYQRIMPNFSIKLLTKDIIVNVPIDKTDHKQKIIVLIDYSGSMGEESKQDWVNAIMIDRLRYCIKEEAEVYFSFFVSKIEKLKFIHIKDRESAITFWKTFSNVPTGGTTLVGDMVNYIKDQIETHKKLHNLKVDLSEEKPEILVISDRKPVL